MNDFPWREYTDEELLTEYYKLKMNINKKIEFPIIYSRIGYKCSNFFFQFERMNTAGYGRPSTIEYWNKNKKNIIKFSKKENRDLFSTLNYFNHAPSQFPIFATCQIYKYFKAKKVLDLYAGWGDRCISAMALNIDYTGIDCNINLKKLYKYMIDYYPTKSNINMIYKKSENVDIDELEFDFVLTSPPFWRDNKLLELYNNTETSYTVFLKQISGILIKCLKKKIWVCLYIPNNMYKDLVKAIGKCRKIIYIKTNNSDKLDKIYCWKY